ncbi:hypothetical protein L1987_65670 [Smallanthus sonchifolius]|uniref:Uncharacterized protein n=1 Tax=Smallanthus sonchifolius TaxID=185202 RepID=A0ACB9BVC3_9ASTR|nr:hypothetical protein L1987_65670 [Smallanthus sonchifolius]
MEESDLHEGKLYATKHLLKLKGLENDPQVLEHINQALEVPLYHRMPRLQARCYIDAYNKQQDANLLLQELATLDFNMTQAAFKTELKEVSMWWENIGLAHKLAFVRDRLMECFFWTVGVVSEPQYHSCRVWLTKVCTFITVIDDIYDVYGSQDELEIFTDAVKSGENYSKRSLWKQTGLTINTFQCSMSILNAWRSVSGVVILTHGYFLINQEIKKDVVESLEKYQDLMKWSSMVFRLYNDLATSSDEMERGKTVNAISCYMHENGVCEEVARAYITTLIDEGWRNLIKVHVACSQDLRNPFIDMAINLARVSRCTYQYGDGHGAPDARAKIRVLYVIIDPHYSNSKAFRGGGDDKCL